MVGIERGHSSPALPAPLAPAPRHRQRQRAAPAHLAPPSGVPRGIHGALRSSRSPQPEGDAGSPPRLPRWRPRHKWPLVFANIVARGWEGLGPPQRAPLCCADPRGLISIPPGRSPRSFQCRQASLAAPPACPSLQLQCQAHSCAPAPHCSHPGGSCPHPGVLSCCVCHYPTLSCSVLVPLRVCAHLHRGVSTRARAATIRGGCVCVCVRFPPAQPHPLVHTCPPTCGKLPAMCAHSAVFKPPCTPSSRRVPQIPPPQLSRVPGAGRQLHPAQHSQTPRHRDTVSSSGLPTAPCTPSRGVTPSLPQTHPPTDPRDPAQCSWFSGSARLLEPVFYGPTQHLRINANPHFI